MEQTNKTGQKPFALTRTKQCATCPWKVGSDTDNIPGYSEELHHKLQHTIAKDASLRFNSAMHIMACHYSTEESNEYCIGWLNNQLGPGNNIALRIHFLRCTNINNMETYGSQHLTFEDALPKKNKRKME